MDYVGVLGGPVDKGGFTVDEIAFDGAEFAAVAGDGAMVAENEILAGWDDDRIVGTGVAVVERDVGLIESLAVDDDAAVVDF